MVNFIWLILPWFIVGSVWFDDKTGNSGSTLSSILLSKILDSDDDGRKLVIINLRRAHSEDLFSYMSINETEFNWVTIFTPSSTRSISSR